MESDPIAGAPSASSPFTAASVSIPVARRKANAGLWVGVGVLALLAVVVGGFLAYRAVQSPYRTLTDFPVDKYFGSYRSLTGARFKAALRVEADLGFKPDTGRLMAFSTPDDGRILVVLIPPSLKDIYFTKGQTYTAQLEVGEGGLIHAYSFEKN